MLESDLRPNDMRPEDVGIGRLFWSLADAIVVGDVRDERIVLWNPAAEMIFGYSMAEARNLPLDVLVPASLRADHLSGVARYRDTGHGMIVDGRAPVEVPALRKDGREILVELTLSPIDWDGQRSPYVVAIIRDVTERARTEAALEDLTDKLELEHQKVEFLSFVAHELRTPVTVIQGYVQLLRRQLRGADEATQRKLQAIERGTSQLSAVISDVLDLSRIQTGRLEYHFNRLDYAAVVRSVTEEMTVLHPERTITMVSPPSVVVLGDEARLRQVLINLIDNALKYGPGESPVRIAVEVAGTGTVTTYVRDEGPPLPPADRERVFERFYRLPSDRAHAEGLGIGLYISRGIIEALGGRIWIADDDHSSFAFSLPPATRSAET